MLCQKNVANLEKKYLFLFKNGEKLADKNCSGSQRSKRF
jgi:hypothetical protein